MRINGEGEGGGEIGRGRRRRGNRGRDICWEIGGADYVGRRKDCTVQKPGDYSTETLSLYSL